MRRNDDHLNKRAELCAQDFVPSRALRPLATTADFVLIDMPPGCAAASAETLFNADFVLVSTRLERHSLEEVTLSSGDQ